MARPAGPPSENGLGLGYVEVLQLEASASAVQTPTGRRTHSDCPATHADGPSAISQTGRRSGWAILGSNQ
ncbi:hypothetical protein [Streptomyces sp. BK205]|uniref:hypothetical protein n=1 Tax=Streptomyces TaxID=1883 RepID=UPI00104B0B20|nr:hypothetical protein [Streptomyces sp. BK205]